MSKKIIPELKIETTDELINLHVLSLLEYKRETYLCVIDNINSQEIGAYVLDYAEQEGLSISSFLSVVIKWFYAKSEKHPLSVELSKHGLANSVAPIYKTFETSGVSRIVGHAFSYENMTKTRIRRRKVVPIQEGIAIKFKKSTK